jgi:lipopolysaccharide/colanic/teichoic acid biosynthesis glycosyltransferase
MIAERDPCAPDRHIPRDGTPARKPHVPGRVPRCGLPVRPAAYLFFKRLVDFFLALVTLVLVAPLVGLASLLVKMTSRGPVFYSQVRLGLRGRPFTIYKIRTMVHDCEKTSGPRWAALHGDPRITRIGRILRRTHIDELPQLWNVLRGDMSLIGPRPERPEFVPQLEQVIPYYRDRLLVRPGMAGLAQVQLPADTDLNSVRRKLACDLYYVQHLSPLLDLKVTMATALYLVKIPFSVARWLFRVPAGAPIQQAYDSLVAAANVPENQAVNNGVVLGH